jgi:hypothetical protein
MQYVLVPPLAVHVPEWQKLAPALQGPPSVWACNWEHTGAPVLQSIVPTSHSLELETQVAPWLHATQALLELHTDPVPQDAPDDLG